MQPDMVCNSLVLKGLGLGPLCCCMLTCPGGYHEIPNPAAVGELGEARRPQASSLRKHLGREVYEAHGAMSP